MNVQAGYMFGVPVTAYSLNIGAHSLSKVPDETHCNTPVLKLNQIQSRSISPMFPLCPAGQAHTDFAEAKLQRRLIEGCLEDNEIDALAVVALAGAAAEAMQYEEVSEMT
jgi:hypothetical protein